MIDVEDPKSVWEAIERFLKENSLASVTELNRSVPVNRNWLAGFLAACEYFGYLKRSGTKTFKVYTLKMSK
ncbi:MAG: hypothetical protein ACUVTD_01535 [Nitrososphaerales archaeon]